MNMTSIARPYLLMRKDLNKVNNLDHQLTTTVSAALEEESQLMSLDFNKPLSPKKEDCIILD